ncbi:MAG: acyl-CoA dehydrogenase family protein, partial [Pseudomonadales bacterium]|nr:acyl-CoA dehydrogenase family protein [Pseudomonadales bacterium]
MSDLINFDPCSEELTLFRETVRKFIKDEIMPHYDEWEKAQITPRNIWNKFGEAGLLGVDVGEKEGGIGDEGNWLTDMCCCRAGRYGYMAVSSYQRYYD